MTLRKIATLGLGVLLGTLLHAGAGFAATVTISCSATGHDLAMCTQGAEAWA
jgi:trehalose/maltose transport system substrate-binding protein